MSRVKHVICALSGGVDSAVSAHLLKSKGYEVTGCFMHNWDHRNDESGQCSSEQDLLDAKKVCDHLDIPLNEVNFTREYWTDVFEPFIDAYTRGVTLNPDVFCNRHIKFDRLLNHALNILKGDAIATGHYAQTSYGELLQHRNTQVQPKLLCSRDVFKDQTYFLAQIRPSALQHTMFPLANYMKPEVKQLADDVGLGFLNEKDESMGICFVGKRTDFMNFLKQYINSRDGDIVDFESGKVIGTHTGAAFYTYGQSIHHHDDYQCGFVAHTDIKNNVVYVCRGTHHPLLYSQTFTTESAHWISASMKHQSSSAPVHCFVRCQRLMPMTPCTVVFNEDGTLHVTVKTPLRAVRGGQLAAFYDPTQTECYGGAVIRDHGPTLFDNCNTRNTSSGLL